MCLLCQLPVAKNHNFDTFGGSCTHALLPIRAKFGVLEHTQGLHLRAKFHLNVFTVSASGGQKLQFWANFDIFWNSCTDPLLLMRAKFAVLDQTQGQHLPAKFHLNVFIVSASGGQKPQFWTNFDTFGGSCTHALLPMRAKFGVLEQTQGLHLRAKFHLNVFIVSASGGQKPQFSANFDIFGSSCTNPVLPMILMSYSRPTVYVYLRNLVLIGLICRLVAAKNPNFCRFLDFGI